MRNAHNTYAPAIVNPDAHYSLWTTYRFNATYYLNGKAFDEVCEPINRTPLYFVRRR